MNETQKISIIGAGSFGTAIAVALSNGGNPVSLLCRTEEQARAINISRKNARFFPDVMLTQNINATSDLMDALHANIVLLTLPAREVAPVAKLLQTIDANPIVLNMAKGLDTEFLTFADLFECLLPEMPYAAIKGPTFSRPLLLGEPSALTCGTKDVRLRQVVSDLFRGTNVKIDFVDCPKTVDFLGALKNVYAIYLGIISALGVSPNTFYMRLTDVIREMTIMLKALELDSAAMFSYCGIGDLLLTGLNDTSRNRTLGVMIGKGISIDNSKGGFLSEGVRSVELIGSITEGLHLPILTATGDIISGKQTPMSAFCS